MHDCILLKREQNAEECDATGFHSSNTVWLIIKTPTLNVATINNVYYHLLNRPMHTLLLDTISEILIEHKELLKIPLRQKAKFEGWLKFELAFQLEKKKVLQVEVESSKERSRDRRDISFFHAEKFYTLELKTSNTNWKCNGITPSGKPITKNIQSIISDAKKLNSAQGIVAFLLFPIPCKDSRWKPYIDRIAKETGIEICKEKNCRLIEMNIDEINKCEVLICVFMSRQFHNWF